jgi:hypothetical protein
MKRPSKVKDNGSVRVGKAKVTRDRPSHVAGVREGNATALLKKTRNEDNDLQDGMAFARATRSTGINPKHRLPIDPRMPNLTPA